MIFNVEDLIQIKDEIYPLLEENKKEVCVFGEDIPLDPDWSKYEVLNKAGILHTLTARSKGRLVGYYLAVVTRHLHYNFLMSDNDVLYMAPEARGILAVEFFKFVENYMREFGVKIMSFSIKPHVDFRGMAEYLGFNLMEYIYMKRLN